MTKPLLKVNWYDPCDAAAATLTIIVMPLTYSIAYGLIAGLGTYLVCFLTFSLLEKIGIERPSFTPPEKVENEPVKEISEGAKDVDVEA